MYPVKYYMALEQCRILLPVLTYKLQQSMSLIWVEWWNGPEAVKKMLHFLCEVVKKLNKNVTKLSNYLGLHVLQTIFLFISIWLRKFIYLPWIFPSFLPSFPCTFSAHFAAFDFLNHNFCRSQHQNCLSFHTTLQLVPFLRTSTILVPFHFEVE